MYVCVSWGGGGGGGREGYVRVCRCVVCVCVLCVCV